jgi:tripartite-type tricarboxylate transporter receptor subunit TctC
MTRTSFYFAAALCVWTSGAQAQDFPTRFVTIVAPFQAGGPSDTVARLIAGPMSKALGQQVVVENTTGAGGTIGSLRVAKAAPDGYTLVISAPERMRRSSSFTPIRRTMRSTSSPWA